MSSKGRQIAKTIGKSLKKKFDVDFFQFPFGFDDQQKDFTFLPHGSPTFAPRQIPKMQSSPRSPRKSNSLSTITTTEASDPTIVDHDEIIALTHDVKKFSDSLARLKALFTEGIDEEDDARVIIHESLGEVLSVLNPVMQHYPPLQSPDIFTAARGLITMIKDHKYEDDVTSSDLQSFCEAIDQLALAFSSSVSEYLMGDMGPQVVMDFKTKSMNNIAGADEGEGVDESEAVPLSPEELDSLLVGLESGLSLALQRAKVWSKYLHDIITYMEKKAQLEYDYAKNLGRLAHSVQNSLKKEGFLPLQSVYCTALSHDDEFVVGLQATQSLLQRFVEPLSTRRVEHDKVYKSVKEAWHRECRRMTDSVTNLRKSQALYHSRQQDHERARELALKAEGDKIEKKKKAEEEALHKTAEAETTYKACVAEANYRQQELFKIKGDLLARVREQIELCDQVIKNVTVDYFHLYHSMVSPLPLQYQTLSESSKGYVPGCQYAEYVRRLPPTSHRIQPENFVFEPYVHGLKPSSQDEIRKESVHSNGSVSDHAHSPDGSPVTSPRRDKYRIPVKAWGQTQQGIHSDTDSASCSSKSHESSPSGSPQGAIRRHLVTSQSLDELTEEDLIAAAAAAAAFNGKEKKRNMKRSATLAKDHPSHGPGLILHHRGRGSTTFGVDFQQQVDIFHTKVPPIVSKCLTEIEDRGLMIKGIYRVSGVKSKVEHLCQRFDIDPESVSLEDVHPNIISNVLKLYLRQLPEPLLTFKLYPEFIHAARDNMSGQLVGEELIHCLHWLVKRLPSSNLRTCAVLMHHLQRVAEHSELNHMSASNLGIVFGPTLLRPLEGSASLASLVDTPHQTRAIELLITHTNLIFGPSEDFQVAPSQTPIETLDQSPSDASQPAKPNSGETSGMPAKIKSNTIESDDSSLSVFESSSPSNTPSSATQPTPSEYVLPGSADFEQIDPQSLSLNGLDLDSVEAARSDEDEELPEITLPDKSKPQTEALSVALSPQSISVTSGYTGLPTNDPNMLTVSSKTAVPKSASTPAVSKETLVNMPSSLSAPTAMSDTDTSDPSSLELTVDIDEKGLLLPKTGRMHESHSTGDLLQGTGRDEGGGEKYASDLLTGKKKPHSQKLENIKFLTRAPSVDEVSNIMDELMIKSSGISPLPSPGQGSSPHSASSPMPSPTFFGTKHQAPKTDVDKPPEPQNLPATSEQHCQENPVQVEKASVEKDKGADSSQSKVTSRKSILEEMPIPTLNKPRRHATSDGGAGDGDDDEQVPPVTIPASPTIKRREMPSKIPSSPGNTRISDVKAAAERIDNRAEMFRQKQRKLVSAIKSDSKRSSSRPSSTGDNQTDVFTEEVGLPGEVDDILIGGCALAVQRVTRLEELVDPFKDGRAGGKMTKIEAKNSTVTVQEEKSKTLPGKQSSVGKIQSRSISSSVTRLSSSSSSGVKPDLGSPRSKADSSSSSGPSSPSKPSSSGPSSPSKPSSSGKSRELATNSSVLSKKSYSSAPSTSSSKILGTSRTTGLVKTSTSSSSSSPKRCTSTSSQQSPKTPIKTTLASKSTDESLSPKPLSSKGAKAPDSQVTRGVTESSPSKTTSGSPTISTKPRLKHKSGDQTIPSYSPASSPSRPLRSVTKKSTYSGSGSDSPRQSTSSAPSASSPKPKPTQLPTASSTSSPVPEVPSPQTTSSSSSSSSTKLSMDRTPRFV